MQTDAPPPAGQATVSRNTARLWDLFDELDINVDAAAAQGCAVGIVSFYLALRADGGPDPETLAPRGLAQLCNNLLSAVVQLEEQSGSVADSLETVDAAEVEPHKRWGR